MDYQLAIYFLTMPHPPLKRKKLKKRSTMETCMEFQVR